MQSSQHPLNSHLGTLGKGCTMQQSLQSPFPSLKTHSYLIESALVQARTCTWVSVSRGRVMSLALWLMGGRGWAPPGASWWQFSRVSLFLSETTVETLRLPADSKRLLPLSHFSPYLGCSQALRHLLVAQPALPGTVYSARKGEITVGGEAAGLGDRKTSLLATFILLQPCWGRSHQASRSWQGMPWLAGGRALCWEVAMQFWWNQQICTLCFACGRVLSCSGKLKSFVLSVRGSWLTTQVVFLVWKKNYFHPNIKILPSKSAYQWDAVRWIVPIFFF